MPGGRPSQFRCPCVGGELSATGAGARVPAAVAAVTGAGTESPEQTLERDEISLWLESDRLSALPPGGRRP